MADYFLDDFANATNDGASWATCFETWAEVAAAGILTTSGNRLFVGADANITDPGAALTITGPTSGLPVIIISSTVGSGTTVSYAVGTGKQVDTDSGAYAITFDGAFALYGLNIVSGASITIANDTNESFYAESVTFAPGGGGILNVGGQYCRNKFRNIVIDLTADGTTTRTTAPVNTNANTITDIDGLTFVNAGYRTGTVIGATSGLGTLYCAGADFSGFTNGTECELVTFAAVADEIVISNCITKASFVATTGSPFLGSSLYLVNVGPADAPSALSLYNYFGTCLSTASIYRTGGATVEGDACAWLITTTANCAEGAPFYTPWIYGTVSSTGSHTFDLYVVNDTADFDNSMVWLEVESLSMADEAIWALGSDQRDNGTGAFISITEAVDAQTDDTTSTWNGTGPSFTYKQKLSVTATVNETGQFRARVAVGVASIASSRYFYVDPAVFVDGVLATSSNLLIPGAGIVGSSGGASPRFGDRTGGLR